VPCACAGTKPRSLKARFL